jgi:predicted amidohydrolase
MKLAVFQFASSGNIDDNVSAIKRAIETAAKNGVRLLAFHECALCGYPPVEQTDLVGMDRSVLRRAIETVKCLAKENNLFVAMGTAIETEHGFTNSMLLFSPDGETLGSYSKRALWGYDLNHFEKGKKTGIFEIEGIRVGFRICYEVRFPEYFRELFKERVQLCFVSFSDVSEEDSLYKYELIKAHLRTRAVENVMTVVSVNSVSKYQSAPTAVFDVNGELSAEAPRNQEYLLMYDYVPPQMGYFQEGRLRNSCEVMGIE